MLTTDLSLRFDPTYEKYRDAFLKIQMNSVMLLPAPGLNLRTATWDRVPCTWALKPRKKT